MALGAGSTTAAVVNTTSATIGGTAYTFAGSNATSTVSVGAAGKERTITNVGAGRLSATSTDAVNGSQLYAADQAINQNTSDISNVAGSVTNIGGNVTNLSNQINNVYNTGTKYFHANSTGVDSTATGVDSVAIGSGAVSTNKGDVALGAGSTTAAVVNTTSATIGGTAYTFAGSNATSTVSVGSVGAERTITNVAAGRLSASSTDAVNGSQLYATNQAVNQNTSDITNLAGDITNITGGITNIGDQINNVYNTGTKYFHANSTGVDSTATGVDSVAIGSGAVAANANDVALGANSISSGAVATTGATINGVDYTFAGTSPIGTLSIGSVGHERTITNVAAGRLSSTSTDAVNGSQLYATNQAVTSLENQVTNITNNVNTLTNGVVKYDTNADGTPNTNSITMSGDTYNSTTRQGGTTIHNVAYGVDGGDAVNVDQLNDAISNVTNIAETASNPFFTGDGNRDTERATATGTHATAMGANANASGSQATAIGAGATASAANSVALGANSVADRDNTVSVGSAGSERQVTNVAAGTQGTDAVNLNQLNQSIAQGVTQANSYTDQRVNALGDQITSVARGAYAGVAAATALTMIPDVDQGKTIAVGVGTANYKGYQATALGASARITQNLKLKIGAGYSSAGTTVGAGASYQW
ncbi:putative trimeric autoransporter, BpaB [Caballeronia ptereochthonis]|uniref:Trimeric autoransporter, BpaB n=1 Tax=Caballeronia ptereochthonis TaxID=1777144 RepID=A0A158DMK9_9BURK|nr:putative trimeric autoransporter, BpaB [Caballeronia ptereochthonis]